MITFFKIALIDKKKRKILTSLISFCLIAILILIFALAPNPNQTQGVNDHAEWTTQVHFESDTTRTNTDTSSSPGDVKQNAGASFATIGGSGASDVGLRADSGGKVVWSLLSFNSAPLVSGQAIKFAIRTSDDGTTWSSLMGRNGSAIDWTTGTGNYFGQAYSELANATITGVDPSRYIDIAVRLESDGTNTPVLNDVRLDYDKIQAPDAPNLSIYRSDGSTQISNGGYSNETSIKFKIASMTGLSDSASLTAEVEIKPVGTAFDGSYTAGSAVGYSGSPVDGLVTLSGLSAGSSYHMRARIRDNSGRVSAWTNFNNDQIAVTIDQTVPVAGTVVINSNADYAASRPVTLDLSAATDPGSPSSGLDKVMVSEDPDFTLASWQDHAASLPFTLLSSGDGAKTVYVKYKDKAGNISTDFNFSETFTSENYKDTVNTTAIWNTINGEVKLSNSAIVSWAAAQASWNPPIDVGLRASPAFADLDGDGDQDLLIGNNDNPAYGYKNTGTASSPVWAEEPSWNLPVTGRPAFADLDGDGDQDVLIGNLDGITYGYKNTGTVNSPVWTAEPSWDAQSLWWPAPTFADLDGDGDQDLLIGDHSGVVYGYKNTGTLNSPVWTAEPSWDISDFGAGARPALADLDSDGDQDVLIGSYDGQTNATYGFKNTGTSTSPTWTKEPSWDGPNVGFMEAPALADLDGDSDKDLMIGENLGRTYAFKNTTTFQYQSPENIQSIAMDSTSSNIIRATLAASDTKPSQTNIQYYLSADGGASWEPVTSGVELTLTNPSSDLRFKATLETSNNLVSSSIQDLSLSYKINPAMDSIVLDTTRPTDVSGLGVNSRGTDLTSGYWYNYYTSGTSPYFAWIASTDGGSGLGGYNVYFGQDSGATAVSGGSFQTVVNFSPSSLTDPSVNYFRIASKDNAGNYSANESSFVYKYDATAPDITKRQSNGSVFAISATASLTDKIQVTWPKVWDNSDSLGGGSVSYKLYRKVSTDDNVDASYDADPSTPAIDPIASDITTTNAGGNYSYDDDPGTDLMYNYKVKAVDVAGNISGLSDKSGNGYKADLTPPSPPTNVVAVAQANGTSIIVSWDQSFDNVGIEGYKIYRTTDGLSPLPGEVGSSYQLVKDTATTSTSYTDIGLTDNTRYFYRIKSYDTALTPNESAYSEKDTIPPTATDITPDVTAPAAPSWVTVNGASGYNVSRNDLEWSVPADLSNDGLTVGTGVSGYDIYKSTKTYDGNSKELADLPTSPEFGTEPLNSTRLTTTSYSDDGLEVYTWYAYKLKVYDNVSPANASADSSIVWVRTKKDTQPIGVSSVDIGTPPGDGGFGDPTTDPTIGHNITLTFNGGASRNDVLDYYEIYRATSASGPWTNKVKTFIASDMVPVANGIIDTKNYNDNDTASNYTFTDTGLNDNTTYYYKIRVVDTVAGSDYDSWTNAASSATTKDVTAPAAPSTISVVDLYPKGTIGQILGHPILTISWPHIADRVGHPTDPADYVFKEYRLYRSADNSFTSDEIIYNGTGNYYVDEVVSSSAYYKITSADGTVHNINNDQTKNNESLATGPVSAVIDPTNLDKVAPALISRNESVLANQATIDLTFDEATQASIEVGSAAGSYTTTVGDPDSSAASSVVLRKLQPDTTYHYRVVARDNYDNELTSSDYTFKTPQFSVSDVKESAGVSTASIKWKANAVANSFIEYSTGGQIKTVADANMKNASDEHSLSLPSLSAGTKYYYQVISMDEYSNKAVKSGSFTTEEFAVKGLETSNVSTSKAVVTWSTNADANSFVEYTGRLINKKKTNAKRVADSPVSELGIPDYSTQHRVELIDLKPSSKYEVVVKSVDKFGNKAVGAPLSFETKPFEITSVASDANTNSVIITWKTNIEANSNVEFKSEGEDASQVAGDASYVKDHKVEIKNLKSDTNYSFKVKSRNKEDNIAESEGILSFKTKSLQAAFNVNPQVSELNQLELTATTAKINWTTESETTSWVEYGTTKALGKLAGNDTLTIDHVVELVNLTPGNTYYYRVKGQDENGDSYQSKILSFTALVKPSITSKPQVKVANDSATITWKTNVDTDSIVEYGLTNKYGDSTGTGILSKDHEVVVGNLSQDTTYHFRVGGVDKFSNKVMGEEATFKTNKDTKGPVVSDARSEVLRNTDESGKERISVITSFSTDEEASSYIEYAEGISMATYNKKTRENETLNLSHSMIIEGLRAATTYHYRIVTKDKYGNISRSADKTILTPKESESVLQKIIRVLENTFSWVKNMREYMSGKGQY